MLHRQSSLPHSPAPGPPSEVSILQTHPRTPFAQATRARHWTAQDSRLMFRFGRRACVNSQAAKATPWRGGGFRCRWSAP